MRKYTEYELNNIIQDYDNGNGLNLDELSKKYNRSKKGISEKLRVIQSKTCEKHKYTDDDILFLKDNYVYGNWEEIFKRFPNLTKQSIYQKMSKLGIKQINEKAWSSEEIEILKNNYTFGDIEKLCNLLPKRTYKAITTKAKRIGLYTRELWTNEEKQKLLQIYPTTPLDEVEKQFPSKNRNSIIHQAMKLNITSFDKNSWTSIEDEYIKNNWELQPDWLLSKKLNRTQKAIQARRLSLGIYRRNMEQTTYETIAKYIRGHIQKWKKESMENCNYQCIFTGSKNFQIHHLYGVSNIINDIVIENNFNIYDNFSDYSAEELNNILKAFLSRQDEYPLGVCVSKDIHVMFHSLYGQYYNTPEQWYRFEKDYTSGVYNEIIKLV